MTHSTDTRREVMFLLLVLVRNPVAFVRAISLDSSFGHPRWAYARYAAKHTTLAEEAIRQGLEYEDIFRKGLLGAWYAAAHGIARMELYRAGREYALQGNTGRYVWRKLFGPVTAESQLHELAAVCNKTAGAINYAALGIPKSQQQIESALVFPRYARCLLGLLTDAIQGRVRGNESRRLLAQVGLVAAVVLALVL